MPTRKRVALIGTGHRGATTWGRDLVVNWSEQLELVGLADANPLRLERARTTIGVDAPTFAELGDMLSATRPDTLIVCTPDDTHADMVVAGLEAGADVITEKPMTTTAENCRRILEAERRTGRRVDVTFNYRYSPTSERIKQLLVAGAIGEVASVDFHWYLDTQHGADYFRRWHAILAHSGSLFVHKATHHFDLLNWFLASDPMEVFARGALRHYGRAGPVPRTALQDLRVRRPLRFPHRYLQTTPGSTSSTKSRRPRTDIFAINACSARRSTFSTR